MWVLWVSPGSKVCWLIWLYLRSIPREAPGIINFPLPSFVWIWIDLLCSIRMERKQRLWGVALSPSQSGAYMDPYIVSGNCCRRQLGLLEGFSSVFFSVSPLWTGSFHSLVYKVLNIYRKPQYLIKLNYTPVLCWDCFGGHLNIQKSDVELLNQNIVV